MKNSKTQRRVVEAHTKSPGRILDITDALGYEKVVRKIFEKKVELFRTFFFPQTAKFHQKEVFLRAYFGFNNVQTRIHLWCRKGFWTRFVETNSSDHLELFWRTGFFI